MPGMYAHYRFGRQVLGQFSPSQKQTIGRFRRLYDMGLYGPDIFDYCGPLTPGEVADLARSFRSQGSFLPLRTLATTEGARAYFYGLLAHCCLDGACAELLEKQSGAPGSRAALEADFDGYLLELDGLPPLYDRSAHMALTRGECVTVSQFYPPATAAQTHGAIARMRRFYHLLSGQDQARVGRLVKLFGKGTLSHRLPPMELSREKQYLCSSLLARYTRAVKAFPELLATLEQD